MNEKKKDRRLDQKRMRQADKAAIRGDRPRQIHCDSWNHRPEAVVLPDESIVPTPATPAKRKPKSKSCKKNKGGPHVPVQGRYSPQCDKCGKRLWGYRDPEDDRDPHYQVGAFIDRINGRPCPCSWCQAHPGVDFYQDL